MKKKMFYAAFNIIYREIQKNLGLTQKEAVFHLVFGELYSSANFTVFDFDQYRKITSGGMSLHSKVRKKLHTYDGFETLRYTIETECLPNISKSIIQELANLVCQVDNIPEDVKNLLTAYEDNPYELSRAIAGILDCLDYSDYLAAKNKNNFINIGYMRLSADKAPTKHPAYISVHPENGVERLFGRNNDLETLHKTIINDGSNLLVTAVGGLGKTELVKKFLSLIRESDVNESGIEAIAWIPYNNNDLRASIKQAMPSLKCDIDDVWLEIQALADEFGKRMLLVIDNIEMSDDEYLRKLCNLSCRVLVTSRQRNLPGFINSLDLKPLDIDDCRELFYSHYFFEEHDTEVLNDIIELTARLTIMIVFIAKAASLEGFTLHELYRKLVEKGFKLSEEDVSCEHEKLQNDETIIQQMCILFSLIRYSEADKMILTYISVIPNLRFDFPKAKRWFNIKKNSSLMKLFSAGMLEHVLEKRSHIYWMHSVIAAAIREQQKTILYEQCSPFMHELSEDLECGEYWGTAYTKIDLIPFSWSIADLLENHMNTEDDATFLLRLFYICFEASNYPLCATLIHKVIYIDESLGNPESLIRDYKNISELYLRLNKVNEALKTLKKAEKLLSDTDPEKQQWREWAYLWHIYGNIYFHDGIAHKALDYYSKALEIDLKIKDLPNYELATDYLSIAMVYQMCNDNFNAYQMAKKAIEIDDRDDNNSEFIMSYFYLGEICTGLISDGHTEYIAEGKECYKTVIEFRERNMPKYCHDMADAYYSYSTFLYHIGDNKNSIKYSDKACEIYTYLYGEDSYSVLQCFSNKALVTADYDIETAIEIYAEIIKKLECLDNVPFGDKYRDYQNYAEFLEQADRYKESIIYFQKAIDMIIEAQSADTPTLTTSYLGTAHCYMGLQDYKMALEYLEKLDTITPPEDNLLKQIINHKIATCHIFLRDFDVALEFLFMALEWCNDESGDNTGYIYADIGKVYSFTGNESESESYHKVAVDYAAQTNDEQLAEYINTLFTNDD